MPTLSVVGALGIRYAQQMVGHASTKYIWRYVQPSRNEMEDAIKDFFD